MAIYLARPAFREKSHRDLLQNRVQSKIGFDIKSVMLECSDQEIQSQ